MYIPFPVCFGYLAVSLPAIGICITCAVRSCEPRAIQERENLKASLRLVRKLRSLTQDAKARVSIAEKLGYEDPISIVDDIQALETMVEHEAE